MNKAFVRTAVFAVLAVTILYQQLVGDVANVFKRTLLMVEGQSGSRRRVSNLPRAAGVPGVLKALLTDGALHGDALSVLTVTYRIRRSSPHLISTKPDRLLH